LGAAAAAAALTDLAGLAVAGGCRCEAARAQHAKIAHRRATSGHARGADVAALPVATGSAAPCTGDRLTNACFAQHARLPILSVVALQIGSISTVATDRDIRPAGVLHRRPARSLCPPSKPLPPEVHPHPAPPACSARPPHPRRSLHRPRP